MSMTALAVTFGILTGKGAVVSLISDVYVDIYIYHMYISYIYSIYHDKLKVSLDAYSSTEVSQALPQAQ